MVMIFVKPLVGLIVRDPKTKTPLPPKGASVPRDKYWLRRLKDKSVYLATEEIVPKSEPPQDMEENDFKRKPTKRR